MHTPHISIVIATRNGAKTIGKVLQGYLQFGSVPYSLIVVDNGSDDNTVDIVREFMGRLPLRILHEDRAGKNRALNRALEETEGSFIIFSDDDAVPQPGFLSAWMRAVYEHEDFDLFGGTVEIEFPHETPPWLVALRSRFPELYAQNLEVEGPIPATGVFGPNMAVRSSVFRNGSCFNENIGPDGGKLHYGMGSETEFCMRMEAQGHRAWFAAEPRVHHLVRPNQMTREFVFTRAYRHGLGVGIRRSTAVDSAAPARSPSFRALVKDSALELASRLPVRNLPDKALWQLQWRKGFRDGLGQALI